MYSKTYDEYVEKIDHICNIAGFKIKTIGKSILNKPILFIEVPAKSIEVTKILLTASIHGNEHPGAELIYKLLQDIHEDKLPISELKEMLNYTTIMIIPVVNPDGFNTWTRVNANCVDLNRNFPVGWGGYGARKGTCCNICCGNSPLDQKESKIIYEKILPKNYYAHLDIHSGTEALAYPYACWSTPPEREEEYISICKLHEEIARRYNIKPYSWNQIPMQAIDIPPGFEEFHIQKIGNLIIYRCCGVLNDTVHKHFNKLSLVLEVSYPYNPSYNKLIQYYYPRFLTIVTAMTIHALEKESKVKQFALPITCISILSIAGYFMYKKLKEKKVKK